MYVYIYICGTHGQTWANRLRGATEIGHSNIFSSNSSAWPEEETLSYARENGCYKQEHQNYWEHIYIYIHTHIHIYIYEYIWKGPNILFNLSPTL